MIVISTSNLSLSFGAEPILEDITFSLNEGDRLGIVGVNGAGKSSLFKLITGEYHADGGSVFVARDARIGVLRQNLGLEGNRSVLEEALSLFSSLRQTETALEQMQTQLEKNADAALATRYASMHERFVQDGGYEYAGRCRGMLRRFGFPDEMWKQSVSSLSGGQRTRLALAKLLLSQPDILMLDEPTNHLDRETLFWLEDYLRAYPKTVIIISHDRYFLDRTVTQILEIEHHRGKLYRGNYSQYVEQKKTDREIAERHYKNQQREIARIEAYIEQQRRWNRERNIIAAESREKQLAKMERVERPQALPQNVRMQFTSSGESGNDVVIAHRLSRSFPGRPLFSNVNFLIRRGDHAFLVGQNGCGKSTLLKIVTGHLSPDSGELELGSNVNIGYYDQENQNLNPDNTVLDELWETYRDRTRTEIRNTLALFLFTGDDVNKKVEMLSGGEKARLTLAKLLLSRMNLLVLDEPTNHLDIPSREALEDALLQFDGTILAVSHDRYFVRKLATRILAFRTAGQELYDFRGGDEEFLQFEAKQKTEEPTAVAAALTAEKEKFLETKKNRSDIRRLEAKRRNTEREITRLEELIADIDRRMEGEAATDYKAIAALSDEREQAEASLLSLYETLEALEEE